MDFFQFLCAFSSPVSLETGNTITPTPTPSSMWVLDTCASQRPKTEVYATQRLKKAKACKVKKDRVKQGYYNNARNKSNRTEESDRKLRIQLGAATISFVM